MEATVVVETFCVKVASVALVIINELSLVALSFQFKVVAFAVTAENVKLVTSPVTIDGGVNRYTVLLPFVVECKFVTFVAAAYIFAVIAV